MSWTIDSEDVAKLRGQQGLPVSSSSIAGGTRLLKVHTIGGIPLPAYATRPSVAQLQAERFHALGQQVEQLVKQGKSIDEAVRSLETGLSDQERIYLTYLAPVQTAQKFFREAHERLRKATPGTKEYQKALADYNRFQREKLTVEGRYGAPAGVPTLAPVPAPTPTHEASVMKQAALYEKGFITPSTVGAAVATGKAVFSPSGQAVPAAGSPVAGTEYGKGALKASGLTKYPEPQIITMWKGKSKGKLRPPPTPEQEKAWGEEVQSRWLTLYGLSPVDVAKAGKIMGGVTTEGDAKAGSTGKLPPSPTAKQKDIWGKEAKELGIADTKSYISLKWLDENNLSWVGVAATGTVMPGVTRKIKGQIVADPQLSQAHEDIADAIDTYIKQFEAKHIKLKDSKGEDVWIPIKSVRDDKGKIVTLGWNDWDEKYQSIALKKNIDEALKTWDADLETKPFVPPDILKNIVAELNQITVKSSVSDQLALTDAMRRAGFKEPSLAHYKRLSNAEKRQVAEKYHTGQSLIGDVLLELMTIGQVKTLTFNEKDIEKQYQVEREIAGAIYHGKPEKVTELYQAGAFGKPSDPASYDTYKQAFGYAVEAKGITPAESEKSYVNRAIGDRRTYTETIVKSQPSVGELAKEFIPFRQLTPAEIKKTIESKDAGKWFDFATATVFDIALVIPIAGWIAKGVGVGLKTATIGAKIARLGGMVGTRLLRSEAKNVITKVAGEIVEKKAAVKLAEKALAKEIAKKGADVGLRREALQVAKADLKAAKVEHTARMAIARENYKVLDDLIKAAEKSPVKTAVEERAYKFTAKTTDLAATATNPLWYTYGTMELGRTLARWDKLSPIERTIGLGMAGLSYGLVGKTAGALKSAWEMTTDVGRIPRRVIEVPEIYLPRGAGMPKTSVRGMTPEEQIEAMSMSAKALEDLWSGKGAASYPWGKKGLKYEPRSEFQKVVPQSMISATPTGEIFKSPIYKVVALREPAQYFSAWGFPEFTIASATGKVGKQPAYLVLFGEKIGAYPTFVGFAKTPKEMQRLVEKMLYEETLRKQAYPGFKLYRKAKEPEWILPAGTEVGAGRSQFLGRIYGGVPLWTRTSPFGKKIELQPHFILGEAGARRTGFTMQEALALKAAGFEAELKHWIEKAQFWRRGITHEPLLSIKGIARKEKPRLRALEDEIPALKTFCTEIDKAITKARQTGDKALIDRLTKAKDAQLRWLVEQQKQFEIAQALKADIERGRTPQARELARDLRAMEALRPALFRIAAARTLERIRDEIRTSRELRPVTRLPVRARVERPAIERPPRPSRPKVPRPERPPARPEIVRVTPPRIPPERKPPERVPPERVPPERVPPIRIPPPKVPPVKPPKPPPPEIKEARPKRKDYKGAIAWAQGRLRREGGKLVTQYKVWSAPYRQEDIEHFEEGELPPGVKILPNISSAYKTIQQFRGKLAPRKTQEADIGAFIATVHQPTAKPGGAGEIEFKRDVSDKIRGEDKDAWRNLVLHTTLQQLITIAFDKPKAISASSEKTLDTLGMVNPAKASPASRAKFAKRELASKIEKTSQKELVEAIRKMELTSDKMKQVLKMEPDRERQQLQLMLTRELAKAPTRGEPKATYLPDYLIKRKTTKAKTKPKKKQTKVEPMLVGVRT